MIQTVIVVMLVVGSVLHAGWVLMPRALRRRLARKLLTLPLPAVLSGPMENAAIARRDCNCHGCEHAAPGDTKDRNQPLQTKALPLVFHRRYKP